MYTKTLAKGTKHEWAPSVDNVCSLSHVAIQCYVLLSHHTYSTATCTELNTGTFLLILSDHILLSLSAFYTISESRLEVPDAQLVWFANLDQGAMEMVVHWQSPHFWSLIITTVGALKKAIKKAKKGEAETTLDAALAS
jgi:hypothetical protein